MQECISKIQVIFSKKSRFKCSKLFQNQESRTFQSSFVLKKTSCNFIQEIKKCLKNNKTLIQNSTRERNNMIPNDFQL